MPESLENTEYEVVGKVQTPYYLSNEKGTTNIGNGKISSYIVVPLDNFKIPAYTETYVTINGAKEFNSFSDEYFDLVDTVKISLETLGNERAGIRYEEIINEANKKLDESKNKLNEEKKNGEEKLNDAKKQLEDAEKAIRDGFKAYDALEENEENLLYSWVRTLPENYANEMIALYEEMAERKTIESKIYKAIDGLEALIQHNISDLSTWIPKEYELNKTYADDKVAFSEYLTELREEIRKDTMEKIGE